MLQLTRQAASEIQGLQPKHLPNHRMVRIAPRQPGAGATARLSFVAAARPGDHVGESRGIPLCVSDDLAAPLNAMVLDVREGQSPSFYVRAA